MLKNPVLYAAIMTHMNNPIFYGALWILWLVAFSAFLII